MPLPLPLDSSSWRQEGIGSRSLEPPLLRRAALPRLLLAVALSA